MSTNSPLTITPDEYERLLHELVAESSPRTFAVVLEYTVEGVPDAEVWAWGMEHPDGRVQVVREEEGRQVVSLSAAQRVLDWCALVTRERARLVWLEGSGGR